MKASVVIRTRNEAKWLPEVLKKLESQTEKEFEVVLVDNDSSDDTIKIFNESKLKNKKTVRITKEKFTYPSAANVGVKNSKAPLIIFLSGHSIPMRNDYIESVLTEFQDKAVAGCYGDSYPLDDASRFEKFYYRQKGNKGKRRIVTRTHMGILGMTSAAIRRSLWREYPYNETVSRKGGEDSEWAMHFLKEGYFFVYSDKMTVRHSHGIGFLKFVKQYLHWTEVYWRARLNNL